MLSQAIPIGINISSPLAWFVIVVAAIVVGLILSTRRAKGRPPSLAEASGASTGTGGAAPAPRAAGVPVARTASALGRSRSEYDDDWSAAQFRFFEEPRAGCELAQKIITRVRAELGAKGTPAAAEHYAAGRSLMDRPDASTDDLRAAFVEFRAAFESAFAG